MPPSHLLEMGKQVPEFFHVLGMDESGRKSYRLKPMEQYAATLPEIIRTYALPKKIVKQSDIDKGECLVDEAPSGTKLRLCTEMSLRASFIDFVTGLLNMDPIKRWSPQQAKMHPFITGEKFAGHWEVCVLQDVPDRSLTPFSQPTVAVPSGRSQAKQDDTHQKKYGGLVSSTRNPRAYPDAASYNQ
jgi:dual specificity protein kinase YAK1